MIRTAIINIPNGHHSLHFPDGRLLQLLPSVSHLPKAKRYQYAALLSNEQSLVVWSDSHENLIRKVAEFEKLVVAYVWGLSNMKGLKLDKGKEVDRGGDRADEFDDVSVNASEDIQRDDANRYHHHHGIDIFMGEDGKNVKKTSGGGNRKHKSHGPAGGSGGEAIGEMSSEVSDGSSDRTVVEEGIRRKPQYIAPVIVTLALMVAILIFGLMARKAPKRRGVMGNGAPLPHITVQIPVYLESLDGGSANIFVNDDGMQILNNKEALKRKNYYDEGRTWAAGDLRIGDLILIVDSDTRVPEDCFMDAAMEMAESPEVAILQHSAGPMLVVFNYWEKGIAFFTEIIYLA
ncbi:hypothetical protein HDU76_004142 [Blyttiomyces sp. JEL0837]|nr:hypothetical protein HDU76_004142 [Blyttiomyces sp. JEL0837]